MFRKEPSHRRVRMNDAVTEPEEGTSTHTAVWLSVHQIKPHSPTGEIIGNRKAPKKLPHLRGAGDQLRRHLHKMNITKLYGLSRVWAMFMKIFLLPIRGNKIVTVDSPALHGKPHDYDVEQRLENRLEQNANHHAIVPAFPMQRRRKSQRNRIRRGTSIRPSWTP